MATELGYELASQVALVRTFIGGHFTYDRDVHQPIRAARAVELGRTGVVSCAAITALEAAYLAAGGIMDAEFLIQDRHFDETERLGHAKLALNGEYILDSMNGTTPTLTDRGERNSKGYRVVPSQEGMQVYLEAAGLHAEARRFSYDALCQVVARVKENLERR